MVDIAVTTFLAVAAIGGSNFAAFDAAASPRVITATATGTASPAMPAIFYGHREEPSPEVLRARSRPPRQPIGERFDSFRSAHRGAAPHIITVALDGTQSGTLGFAPAAAHGPDLTLERRFPRPPETRRGVLIVLGDKVSFSP